jgi:fumarylacetoacetase
MAGRPNPENFVEAPTACNGRASSIQPSPHSFKKMKGISWQTTPEGTKRAIFAPSKAIDFELEMGAIVGTPLLYGETIDTVNVADNIFGFVILNDWSAREIQQFEMPRLGPMNSKAYATTISP